MAAFAYTLHEKMMTFVYITSAFLGYVLVLNRQFVNYIKYSDISRTLGIFALLFSDIGPSTRKINLKNNAASVSFN